MTDKPLSILETMAERYGMRAEAFEATVRAQCSPSGTRDRPAQPLTREEFAAFLLVAKNYGLNPLTREIYAFPKRGGGVIPVVSVDGWINLINSHPQADGWDMSENHAENGNLVSMTCSMFRKDRGRPVVITEYLKECKRDTDPWRMEHRMLRHKALIQAGRYAFGFAGIYDQDEAEKIIENELPAPDPFAGGIDPVEVGRSNIDAFAIAHKPQMTVAEAVGRVIETEKISGTLHAGDIISTTEGQMKIVTSSADLRVAPTPAVFKPSDSEIPTPQKRHRATKAEMAERRAAETRAKLAAEDEKTPEPDKGASPMSDQEVSEMINEAEPPDPSEDAPNPEAAAEKSNGAELLASFSKFCGLASDTSELLNIWDRHVGPHYDSASDETKIALDRVFREMEEKLPG